MRGTDQQQSHVFSYIVGSWEYFVRKNEKTSAGYITLDTQSTDCATQERSGPY
jgi:hypothetical protein